MDFLPVFHCGGFELLRRSLALRRKERTLCTAEQLPIGFAYQSRIIRGEQQHAT
jgi:hypothetical protein